MTASAGLARSALPTSRTAATPPSRAVAPSTRLTTVDGSPPPRGTGPSPLRRRLLHAPAIAGDDTGEEKVGDYAS